MQIIALPLLFIVASQPPSYRLENFGPAAPSTSNASSRSTGNLDYYPKRQVQPDNFTIRLFDSVESESVRLRSSSKIARDLRLISFIRPYANSVTLSLGCELILSTAAGIERADGQLNGYRSAFLCGDILMDVLEFDFRQPLNNNVISYLPSDRVNAYFGPGQSSSHFYHNDAGGSLNVMQWFGDSQEVLFHVRSDRKLTDSEVVKNVDIMRSLVARRLSTAVY